MAKLPIKKNKKGFTLIELLVSVAVFSIVTMATVGAFNGAFSGYRSARELQENLENAQFAMNLAAKTIRTSSVVSCYAIGVGWDSACASGGPYAAIATYEYSQGSCIAYFFDPGTLGTGSSKQLKRATYATSDRNACATWGNYPHGGVPDNIWNYQTPLVGTPITGSFKATKSCGGDPGCGGVAKVGKVTISTQVCSNTNCSGSGNQKMTIQSSVSLRDYSVSGVK